MTFLEIAEEQIKRHEGLRLKVYRCPAGVLTVGWGHNCEGEGFKLGQKITRQKAEELFKLDFDEAVGIAIRFVGDRYWSELNEARKAVIVNMAFNLGEPRLAKFKRLRRALQRQDWIGACSSMVQSLWFLKVGDRGEELEEQMYIGEYAKQVLPKVDK